jgi:hopanoid C-2 methylase
LRLPAQGKLTKVNLKRGLMLACNIIWRIGIVSDYRAAFWRAAWHALRRGQIESGFVAWHLIQFTQEALGGQQNASFYAAKQYSTDA